VVQIFRKCLVCATDFIPKHKAQVLCGKKECKLKRRQLLSNTEHRKQQRHKYYVDNRLEWKGRHGLTKKEATTFTLNKECEICGKTDRLIVDHCHTTGVIRGVLCGQCNTAIGLLNDTFEGVKKAYDYLFRFRN